MNHCQCAKKDTAKFSRNFQKEIKSSIEISLVNIGVFWGQTKTHTWWTMCLCTEKKNCEAPWKCNYMKMFFLHIDLKLISTHLVLCHNVHWQTLKMINYCIYLIALILIETSNHF